MPESQPSSRRRQSYHRPFVILAVLGAVGAAAPAQDAPDAISLAAGRTHAGSLASGEVHRFTVDLGEGQFVYGAAEQVSVDLVVTVFDASGEKVAEFDGPGRGPESFQFDSRDAGAYRIEVKPFEGESGEYEITLHRVEPLATTPEGRVGQLVAPYDRPDVPGGVVAVVRAGEIAYAHSFGAANLTYDITFEVDTRTNIGSTSKQFTAFAVALLAERGELSLDDDVRTHIPELPDLGETVTLRHLLTHTSGYREFLNTVIMTGRRLDRGDSIDRKELIEIVQRQPALQNSPGSEWNYNNTGFGLLTVVVERVTGQPFPVWMHDNVFAPLGMDDTFVKRDPSEIVERSAQGYSPAEGGGYRVAIDLGGAMGAGGIYTTVEDLAAWMGNLGTGAHGGRAVIDAMTTPYVLSTGKSTNYGLGLFIDEQRGLRRIQHGGADSAHRSSFVYFPDLDAGVIVQSNNASFAGGIAPKVAEAFFGDAMQPAEPDATEAADATGAFDPADFDPGSFDALAGRYELEEVPGFILTFTREDDRYYAQATGQQKIEIFPTSADTFRFDIVDANLTFHKDGDGEFSSLTLHQNGDHPAKRIKDEPWSPDAEALGAFAGRYYSEELETFYDLVIEEGTLLLRHRRLDEVKLKPTLPDRFAGGMPVPEVVFERGEGGEVTALLASNGRTRGVRFQKLD